MVCLSIHLLTDSHILAITSKAVWAFLASLCVDICFCFFQSNFKKKYSLQRLVASSLFLKNIELGEAPCCWLRLLWIRFLVGLFFFVLYCQRIQSTPFLLTLSAGALEISRIFMAATVGIYTQGPLARAWLNEIKSLSLQLHLAS